MTVAMWVLGAILPMIFFPHDLFAFQREAQSCGTANQAQHADSNREILQEFRRLRRGSQKNSFAGLVGVEAAQELAGRKERATLCRFQLEYWLPAFLL